jgi:hypothetical protein
MTPAEVLEAMMMGVMVEWPFPQSSQWAAIRDDLRCLPRGVTYLLRRQRAAILSVCSGPITEQPAYDRYPSFVGYKGHANPVPMISADLAYPANGGRSGASVAVHECMHTLHEVLRTEGQEALKLINVCDRNDYRAVMEAMEGRRFERQDNRGEYWAQDAACYWLWNARRDSHIQWYAGPAYLPVRFYFRGLWKSASIVHDQRPLEGA